MSASVKGTTRVSSNDRKLMKDLWVASKDNPVEKNRQKRKLTQNEKQTRENMPEERGKSAFRSLLKKQKIFDPHFDSRKGDDSVAVQTIQQPGWSDFCFRQSTHCSAVKEAQLFQKLLTTRKKRSGNENSNNYKRLIDWVQPMTNTFYHNDSLDASQMFHFLGDFKNKRFSNYRQRCDNHVQKLSKQLTDSTLSRVSFSSVKPDNEDAVLKAVELQFNNNYEATKHQRILLKCDQCGEAVPASDAKHRDNCLFFHSQCKETKSSTTPKFHFQIFAQLANTRK